MDAEAILRTPVRGRGGDIWAWEPEKHGTYTVRSAYRLLENQRWHRNTDQPSSSSDDVWKKTWKLDVLPKIQVFWWRVLHGFLPIRLVLFRRHVEPTSHCEICGAEEESIKHVLIECTIAKEFWKHAKELIRIKLPDLHPHSWAGDLLTDICSQKDRAIIICGMWSLWMSRNKRRHGEIPLPVHKSLEWIKDTAFDLWHILHPCKQNKRLKQQTKWTAPAEHWIKCNIDGSFYEASRQGNTGVVIRDHAGVFCGAQAKWHENCVDALTMEAVACKEGLKFARQCGVQKVHLETGCLEFVRLWKLEGMQRSMIMPILQEVKDISLSFQGFCISLADRECNRVAHEIASHVSSISRLGVWLHESPTSVRELLEQDCNRLS